MSAPALLRAAIRHSVRQPMVTRLLNRRQPAARVLMFHGIGTSAFAEGVFRRELDWLQRFYRIVPLHEAATDPGRAPRPALALTFDDGLCNNFTHAYPALRERGLPATFFVCPQLAAGGNWIWAHEIRARLTRLPAAQLRELAPVAAGGDPLEAIVTALKRHSPAERAAALEKIRQATAGFQPTQQEHAAYDVMSWDQLRALDRALITIGSHTMTHALLRSVDGDGLEYEVAESRRLLEAVLSRPVDSFCYPNGDYDVEAAACVARHFRLAVTTRPGWIRKPARMLEIPRIPAPPELGLLAWRLQRPTA